MSGYGKARWTANCAECGREFSGSEAGIERAAHKHRNDTLHGKGWRWHVTCDCGWTHDGTRQQCRARLKEHRAERDYEPLALDFGGAS